MIVDKMSSEKSSAYTRLKTNQEIRSTIQKMSQLLNTGLNPEALDICIQLCEAGVHPQTLAVIVNDIRKEFSELESSK